MWGCRGTAPIAYLRECLTPGPVSDRVILIFDSIAVVVPVGALVSVLGIDRAMEYEVKGQQVSLTLIPPC